MIYHSTKKNIICHYCGYQKNVPDICPKCNGHNIKHFGFGTERIEAEIKTLFPNAKVGRMDADTTGTKKSHERILTAFKK